MKKQGERTSTTEANIELNESFYGRNEEEVDPTQLPHIESNMAPVNLTEEDEEKN